MGIDEDKFEFFYKPKTKGEIVEDRTIIPATKYDIAQVVRAMSEKQAIILDYMVPEQKLIPDGYEGSENFLKHGRKIVIPTDRPMWIGRHEKFAQIHERKQTDPNYFAEFAGITWKGYGNDQRSRIVHLVDSCEGVCIYHYTSNSTNLEERMELDHRAEPRYKGINEGANYGVVMISRSGEVREKVSVALMGIPFTRKGNPTKVISRLDVREDCPYYRWHNLVYQDDSSRRKRPIFLDMHAIAAYLFIIEIKQKELDRFMEQRYYKRWREMGKKVERRACVAMQENPFPLPTNQTLNDLVKFENQVCIRDVKRDRDGRVRFRKDGKPRTKIRRTNRGDKESFLIQYIATFGPRTFFATKRLRDYEIGY